MPSGGKIDVYLDCNSPYSFYAYLWSQRNKQLLADHRVEIELHPIFLGGINVGSGNKPPWTLPAKAIYSKFDNPRAARYFGTEPMRAPDFFPIMTLLPLRCMLFIKANFPQDRYEAQFGQLWQSYWREHKDISKPEHMKACLLEHFDDAEAERILKGGTDPTYKQLLTDETARLVQKGAFGAPWFVVTNAQGEEEPFFGSDRFAYILRHLGVPFTDVEIKSANGSRL